jgi:hypothetical protein
MRKILLMLLPVMLLTGCKTEWYESGQMKSYAFTLGTAGKDNISLINVQEKED